MRTRTLAREDFASACAALLGLTERDFPPTLLVGIRTGGLVVANAMAQAATRPIVVLPLTCRRPATRFKSRIPGLKTVLAALPQSLLNAMRHAEHHMTAKNRHRGPPPEVNAAEADAIGAWLAAREPAEKVLVVDDAVDSGVTLAAVLETLRARCPAAFEIRTAAITVTTEHPVVEPDFALYRGVLCRFPWSFDAPDG